MILEQNLDSVTTAHEPSKTWFLDFETGHVRHYTDGAAAVAQAAMLMLLTARYRYPIFSFQYGGELQTLVGKDSAFVFSESKRMIADTLSTDDRILSVGNFKMKNGQISFVMTTIFGDILMEVDNENL